MFLKRIELYGFKSFADRAVIEFTDGISALLGPNGCGKSNIVDAVKWVLGEQATRSLRAETMEDVIFNGSEERKPLNVAEVTLTLENDGGLLPIDSAEIAVRRRLFRSGESEYFVNGTPVLLRELRELFYDTGIGKSSYSIMEQGKIDQVLSNKPEERRLVFEEAAGITRYKVRGREAERKLERTEENMRQVEGILGEVGRTHESLKRQAEKTLAYRKLRSECFDVELDLTLLRLRAHVDEQDRRTAQLNERLAERDRLKGGIDRINESLEQNLDVVNTMESQLIEQQKRLYGVELERNSREHQIRIHSERVSELEQQIAAEAARGEAAEARITALEQEIAALAESVREQESRIADVDANVAAFTERVDHASSRIVQNNDEISRLERLIADEEQKQHDLEGSLRELTDGIARQLDEGLASTGYSHETRKDRERSVFTRVGELRRLLASRTAVMRDAAAAGATTVLADEADRLERDVSQAIDGLDVSIREYAGSLPAFLDEFLAPEGIMTRKREADTVVERCREAVRDARAQIAALTAENASLSQRIEEYRSTLEELRVNRMRMSTQTAAMTETIRGRQAAVGEHQRQLEIQREELLLSRKRLDETRGRIDSLRRELTELEVAERGIKRDLAKLEKGISSRNKDLVESERGLKRQMEELGKAQGSVERLQMSVAEIGAEIRGLYDNFRDRFADELSEHEPRMLHITASANDLRQKLSELREQERALGPVNLAAPEEYEEVRQRFEFLSGQMSDLKKAREDLERVTREIQSESAHLFTETYEQIKKNFHVLFRRLFGGGRAELKLADPEDVLESGIEILAQPLGKKLESIALLSGGERSLTAVALLFAIYMVRPSPFCVLDEIDAALDESNVGRFITMLQEFGQSSQFIIVTHNKKTVAAASTLLGVTMEESGVSKVVSLRIAGREEVHAS